MKIKKHPSDKKTLTCDVTAYINKIKLPESMLHRAKIFSISQELY